MRASLHGMQIVDETFTDYAVTLTPEYAQEFVREAQDYNAFTHEDLENLIASINEIIPPMNFPDTPISTNNPNNGKPHHQFKIGNEGSRVIYLVILKFYMPKEYNYEKLGKQLTVISKKCKADEAWSVQDDERNYVFRFWWD
jgi:hypothetical protein